MLGLSARQEVLYWISGRAIARIFTGDGIVNTPDRLRAFKEYRNAETFIGMRVFLS